MNLGPIRSSAIITFRPQDLWTESHAGGEQPLISPFSGAVRTPGQSHCDGATTVLERNQQVRRGPCLVVVSKGHVCERLTVV